MLPTERIAVRPEGILGAGRRPGPLSTDVDALSIPSQSTFAHPTELGGHFTIERRLEGLNLPELEATLGYREGLLAAGARVYVFTKQPEVGQYVFAGSTITPAAKDLVGLDERMKGASQKIPGAWWNERLVKVVPVSAPSSDPDNYPRASTPTEQWVLLVKLPVQFICELHGNDRYFPR